MTKPERFELCIDGSDYPSQLASTPNAPPVLYGIGDPSCLIPGLAVVGARRATPYGLGCARRFAGWAAEAGCVIVSGAAIGCDQAAHRAALDVCGLTVAVLAGGCDIAYPRAAGALLDAIACSGAVVSEHPWGTEPRAWTFRTRNRIIAGLSAALLVVEACVPSGTFSTADYALAAGRDVLAIPGSINAPECRGPNRLIRQGADPITEVSDLRLALESALGTQLGVPQSASRAEDPDADPVFSAVRTDPARPDDLARLLSMDIVAVARRLGALEASGLVTRYRDGRYGLG